VNTERKPPVSLLRFSYAADDDSRDSPRLSKSSKIVVSRRTDLSEIPIPQGA